MLLLNLERTRLTLNRRDLMQLNLLNRVVMTDFLDTFDLQGEYNELLTITVSSLLKHCVRSYRSGQDKISDLYITLMSRNSTICYS